MNLKVILIGAVLTLVFLGGGVWLVSKSQSPAPVVNAADSGALKAAETEYDFGEISMAKGLVSHKFEVKNEDSKTATVIKLYTSCMCTKARLSAGENSWGPFGMPGHGGAIPKIAAQINAGETGEVEVIFDPAAHGPAGVGKIERAVTLEQNGQEPLNLTIRALVTP